MEQRREKQSAQNALKMKMYRVVKNQPSNPKSVLLEVQQSPKGDFKP